MSTADHSIADLRARLAAAQSSAASMPIVSLLGAPPPGTPTGHSAWAVGPLFGRRSIVVMPTLTPAAPAEVHDRLVARVLADATGTCPLCGRAAGLSQQIPDPENPGRGRAAWARLPLYIDVRHDVGCPAIFTDEDQQWFPILSATAEEANDDDDDTDR